MGATRPGGEKMRPMRLQTRLGVLFAVWARRSVEKIPRGIQNVGEWLVERMIDFTRGIIGPGGEKYVPLVV